MKMTADIEQRFAAVDDAMATLGERLDAAETRVAELAKLLGPLFERFAVVDTQQTMIDARANERTPVAKGGGAPTAAPVQFGSATPYDAQVGRIDAKRRELLGKK
jgi:hypothetical protein